MPVDLFHDLFFSFLLIVLSCICMVLMVLTIPCMSEQNVKIFPVPLELSIITVYTAIGY